jgi:putative hydrolase of the HAD superfamily
MDTQAPRFPSRIRAVSFDVGGTLIGPWPSVGHVYLEIARHYDDFAALDPAEVNARFVQAWQDRGPAFDYSRSAWYQLVAQTLAGQRGVAGNPHFFDHLYHHFAGPAPWRVWNDVRPTLARLKASGFRLLAVSNWDDRLRPLLGALDLAACFDVIVVSGELGVHKPDPRIFAQASRLAGVPPAALVHVGDSATEDVGGAREAGWHAVHLVREGPLGEPWPRGNRLQNLTQLADGLAAHAADTMVSIPEESSQSVL